MKLNPIAGGRKSGFLKAVATCQRDAEIRLLVKELRKPVTAVAQDYQISRVRVYQILKREHTVLDDPGHFWSWIIHSRTVKSDFPEEWEVFQQHWHDKEQPPRPEWVH